MQEKSYGTNEESSDLFFKYKASKDIKLRNELVERYLYIAEIMAKKFVNKGVDYDDLYQVASLALLKAIDRFDPSKGLKFSTFATPSIVGEIKNYFRDKVRLINPGRRNNKLLLDIKNAVNSFAARENRIPSAEEIAKCLGEETDAVIEALEYSGGVISLDSKLEDNESSLYEIIPDNDNIFEKIDNRDALKTALSKLSESERKLIEQRFISNTSQADIAKKMGVSQMFVSRLERKTINKLKLMFEND
jgi:RNA polymerase sigma-B factor